jgi:SOS-response transcriptional repressor LexA
VVYSTTVLVVQALFCNVVSYTTLVHNQAMNIVGKNVHKYRSALGLSLEELGKSAGWDKKNLHRLEQTGSGYSNDSITRIAKALNVSLGALFDETGSMMYGRVVPIDFYTPEMLSRDAQGKTAIQRPAHESGGISNVLLTDGSFADAAFAFTVNDDGMRPDLAPGDVIVIDPGLQPEPNDLVLAVIHRHSTGKSQALIRRFADRANGFELLPTDNAYATEISVDNNIGIVGTVVEQRRQRRR